MANEKMIPVTFPNNDGLKLFGILHKPLENKYPDKAIIILSPGIKSRVAPHRLYIKMARKLAEIGFLVLRFDFYGLGDSEGEIDEQFTADLYGSIQLGRYINDTIIALNWMQNKYKIEEFILCGLCGGAITGLFAASDDMRVKKIFGIGIPVILDSQNIDSTKYITFGELESLRKKYFRKFFRPKAWLNFLTFKSDYQIMVKSIFLPFKKNKGKMKNEIKDFEKIQDNSNPFFKQKLERFVNQREILLIFSENDRLFWEFEEKYLERFEESYSKNKARIHIHLIKNANHILSFNDWQNEMYDLINNFLN